MLFILSLDELDRLYYACPSCAWLVAENKSATNKTIPVLNIIYAVRPSTLLSTDAFVELLRFLFRDPFLQPSLFLTSFGDIDQIRYNPRNPPTGLIELFLASSIVTNCTPTALLSNHLE